MKNITHKIFFFFNFKNNNFKQIRIKNTIIAKNNTFFKYILFAFKKK